MIKTYKILSLLLSYPEKDLHEFLGEALTPLNEEGMLAGSEIQGIEEFIRNYIHTPLTEWQEQYVQLFDFSRTVSLHLFEHVHGNSKDRGQAMVDLMEEYSKAELKLRPKELPDYLPVFLEYLSMLHREEAAELLGETVHILAAIRFRLEEKSHPYAHIFTALISLSGKTVEDEVLKNIISNQKPLDPDKEYEEDPVSFGGNDNPCKNCK